MELATFVRRNESRLNQDVATCLTPVENKMCEFFTRVEIWGKRGRGVPVLLKPSMVSAMELLAESREKCGILKENIYMFARPGTWTAYRGGESIQKYASECSAKNPEALSSTKLQCHRFSICRKMRQTSLRTFLATIFVCTGNIMACHRELKVSSLWQSAFGCRKWDSVAI